MEINKNLLTGSNIKDGYYIMNNTYNTSYRVKVKKNGMLVVTTKSKIHPEFTRLLAPYQFKGFFDFGATARYYNFSEKKSWQWPQTH